MKVPGAVTDLSRVKASDVGFPSEGARINGYLAQPAQDGRRGGIIVIPEAFGMVEHIRDLARRFANAGFNALAVDIYSRSGPPDPASMPSVMEKMLSLPDTQVVRDLEAGAQFLRALPNANGKIGCIGFCSGGRQTLLFACSSRQVDAAIDCWGGFITRASPDAETTPSRPTPVIRLVPRLACPLFVVIGETDANPSPEVGAQLEQALKAAGKDYTLKVFPGVGHAFLADYRPSYDEKQAFALWPQIIEFFRKHLGGT